MPAAGPRNMQIQRRVRLNYTDLNTAWQGLGQNMPIKITGNFFSVKSKTTDFLHGRLYAFKAFVYLRFVKGIA